jgi:hypothetical protein
VTLLKVRFACLPRVYFKRSYIGLIAQFVWYFYLVWLLPCLLAEVELILVIPYSNRFNR